MKKVLSVIMGITLFFMLTACDSGAEPDISQSPKQESTSADNTITPDEQKSPDSLSTPETGTPDTGKALVVYFSCTGVKIGVGATAARSFSRTLPE